MEGMALQELRFVKQLAQQQGLRTHFQAQGVFHRLGSGELVADAADATDPANDPRDLVGFHALAKVFEEAVSLDDGQLQVFDPAVAGVHLDGAMALDPGDVVDLDGQGSRVRAHRDSSRLTTGYTSRSLLQNK